MTSLKIRLALFVMLVSSMAYLGRPSSVEAFGPAQNGDAGSPTVSGEAAKPAKQASAPAHASAPTFTLKGSIQIKGDKYTFVNDKDGRSWAITNPEALKSQEGHHVQITGHVYADENAIHVMSVKTLKPSDSRDSANKSPK